MSGAETRAARASTEPERGDRSWRHIAERGSVVGAHFLVWLATTFGRWPVRALLRPIVFYYALSARTAREATHDYLRRMHGESSFGAVYTQMLRVAQVGVDALFLLRGKLHHFEYTRTGGHQLSDLVENKRGAVLLGAHLGSMYAMRAASDGAGMPIRAVVYTRHAKLLNSILERIDPEGQGRLLQMGQGMDFMLRIRELIEEGALIALLGDRVGADDRAVEVDFMGGRARFPTGPYLLASILKCPVYLTFGIYRDPNGYELTCEHFADRIELPRGQREEALARYAQRYAERLEHFTRGAPDNWFNFYDFWSDTDSADA